MFSEKYFLRVFLVWLFFASVNLNCFDSSAEDTEDKSIKTIGDADLAATSICSTLSSFLLTSRSIDKTWSNETLQGYSSGTITLNGVYDYTRYDYTYSYPKKYYKFENVSITCNNLNNDSDGTYPSLSGTAGINGTVIEQTGSYYSSYSGSWGLSGTMTLSGTLEDQVSFSITFSEDTFMRDRNISITAKNGKTYNISD